MKNNKQIMALTAAAQAVTFPGHDSAFDQFKRSLRALVELNFGYNAGKGMDYDEYSKQFYWEAEDSGSVHLGRSYVIIKQHFAIDPTKPLMEEFARVFKEYAAFTDAKKKIARAVIGVGGEV